MSSQEDDRREIGNGVKLHEWKLNDIVDEAERNAVTTEIIDEVLNGQAELLDRPRVEPTLNNLCKRYGLYGEDLEERDLEIFRNDINYFTPQDREINGLEPVTVQYTKELADESANYEAQHHYIGYIDMAAEDDRELLFHYHWTT